MTKQTKMDTPLDHMIKVIPNKKNDALMELGKAAEFAYEESKRADMSAKIAARRWKWPTATNLERWFKEDNPKATVKFSDLRCFTKGWFFTQKLRHYMPLSFLFLPSTHPIVKMTSIYTFDAHKKIWIRMSPEKQMDIYMEDAGHDINEV